MLRSQREEELRSLVSLARRRDIDVAHADLVMPDVFGTLEYYGRRARARFPTSRVDKGPLAFGQAVIRCGEASGVPLYIGWVDHDGVQVLHGWYEDRLHLLHWEALERIGMRVVDGQNYHMRYVENGVWVTTDAKRKSVMKEAIRNSGLVISPITGRLQTEEERRSEAQQYGNRWGRNAAR